MSDHAHEHNHDLTEHDLYWQNFLNHGPWNKPYLRQLYMLLPGEHRCPLCYVPLEGLGGAVAKRLMNLEKSIINPRYCNT